MLTPELIHTLLPLVLLLPLVSALIVVLCGRNAKLARTIALDLALVHLLLTGLIAISAVPALCIRESPPAEARLKSHYSVFAPEFVAGAVPSDEHATSYDIMPLGRSLRARAVQFYIGLDGLNVWMVLLSSLMLVPVILVSWESIQEQAGGYFAWLFVLQAGVIGVFLTFDIVMFYVCFELTLIPLFFLISSWGVGKGRREAARKFFLFTLVGGLFTLVGIVGLILFVQDQRGILTTSIPELADQIQRLLRDLEPSQLAKLNEHERAIQEAAVVKVRHTQTIIFSFLMLGFAVKIPLVPLHSWLPNAYTEAPIGVTVMLSALLAKMGTFGLLRICLPLAPDATLTVGLPVLGTFAAIGIIYGALCAYAQSEIKRLVAYSSVSHLGFCALAIVAFNAVGMSGGMLHMVNHGLSTGALFLVVGMILQRYSSLKISDYSGLWKQLPILTFFMIVFAMASVGLPGLNNFVSEMLMMAGLFELGKTRSIGFASAGIAGIGIFLTAWYTLTMLQRLFFGPATNQLVTGHSGDLNRREFWALAPLAVICLILGLYPQPVLDSMRRDIENLELVAKDARSRATIPDSAYPAPKTIAPR